MNLRSGTSKYPLLLEAQRHEDVPCPTDPRKLLAEVLLTSVSLSGANGVARGRDRCGYICCDLFEGRDFETECAVGGQPLEVSRAGNAPDWADRAWTDAGPVDAAGHSPPSQDSQRSHSPARNLPNCAECEQAQGPEICKYCGTLNICGEE